jgi:hypothetical protein
MTRRAAGAPSFSLTTIGPDESLPSWGQAWLAELGDIQRRAKGRAPAGGSAAARLVTHLKGREAAVARSADGRAFCAVRQVVHPLTGLSETSLTRFAATADEAAELLLSELGSRGLLDRCSVEVELPADGRHAALAAKGFTEHVLVVRRELTGVPAREEPESSLDLHRLRDEEAGFVIDCLATALQRGLSGSPSVVDLAGWAKDHYPLDSSALCMVGRLSDQPVCHALGYRRKDRYGIESVLYLVDVFVTPGHQGLGLSRMATAAIMRAAAIEGYQIAESDVMLAGGSDGLRAGLRSAGWTEDRVRWTRG